MCLKHILNKTKNVLAQKLLAKNVFHSNGHEGMGQGTRLTIFTH